MKVEDAREMLEESIETEDPVVIPASLLSELAPTDIPEGATFQVGDPRITSNSSRMGRSALYTKWSNRGETEHIWTRKYWYSPLGLEQYMDLVRRAVETRHRLRGDVRIDPL